MGKDTKKERYKARVEEEMEQQQHEEVVEEQRSEEAMELKELNLAIPEPGRRTKAKVTRIRKGRLGMFVNIDRIRDPRIRERMKAQADREAVEVCFEVDGREWCQAFIVSNSVRSNIYRLIKRYGAIRPGTEIEVIYNSSGFPRILLE